MHGEDAVGANWKALWRRGVERIDDAYWSTYVWERGDCGTNKTFIIASDAAVSVCKKSRAYFSTGLADLKKYALPRNDEGLAGVQQKPLSIQE